MRNQTRKTLFYPALTLLEMVIGLAMMVVITAMLLPQLKAIYNSWDSQVNASEALQNGRFLIDHLNRTLSRAARITAVSDSATTSGYIEFMDNDANSFRYDVNGTSNYVQFGLLGDLSDLAGPVSQLQFTCYDSNDLDTPITDVDSIRNVKVETTLTNAGALGADTTLSTQAYIRTNCLSHKEITKATPFEYDILRGATPALFQIDSTHYLCAYAGNLDAGSAVVLTVDTGTWDVTNEMPFEYDTTRGATPALSQIDATHFLCAYSGDGSDGWAVVLTVDTGTWNITMETPFEYDTDQADTPALAKIDADHYLCAYSDKFNDGWAVVLTVNTGTWEITKETPFEYDTDQALTPALAKIDDSHYLCAYADKFNDGQAVVLTVNTGTWNITKETPLEYDTANAQNPALQQIDATHYLCAYQGPVLTGWVVVLTVNTGDWSVSKETPFEHDAVTGMGAALAQVDANDYFCAYTGPASVGHAVVMTVDPGTWMISNAATLEFDSTVATTPIIVKIDPEYYICAYTGLGDDGWSVVLKYTTILRP